MQASLARTPGSAYTGALVTFGIVGYIPIAALRASPGNPGPGLITALLYGIALIDSITYYSVGMLWHQVQKGCNEAVFHDSQIKDALRDKAKSSN